MAKLKAFFKLIRWTNLLMIAIMMCLVYYCLMRPLSEIVGALPPSPAFPLLLVAMVFIVAAGYIINDCFDVEIDKTNKPDKIIVSRIFSVKESKLFYMILTVIGLAAGLMSSVMVAKLKFLTLFAMLVLLTLVLYSYSSTYKKKFVVGNLIVSLSVSFAVFLPWLFEMIYISNNLLLFSVSKDIAMQILPFVLVYTLFAFVVNFIREIVKDAEDFDGDTLIHCRTIPIVLGINKTKIILCVLIILLLSLLFLYNLVLFRMRLYIVSSMMILLECCSLLLLCKLYKARGKDDFHEMSVMTKIIMLLGVLSMLFII